MITEADTLVAKYPTAAAQLRGPVLDYLRRFAPFPTEQSLYLAVFYPAARFWSADREFPESVRSANPGIVRVRDYVDRVRARARVHRPLDADTLSALSDVSGRLGVPIAWLRSLIEFESGFDPAARNSRTGARGLIQFLPRTARIMGFTVGITLGGLLVLGVVLWLLSR